MDILGASGLPDCRLLQMIPTDQTDPFMKPTSGRENTILTEFNNVSEKEVMDLYSQAWKRSYAQKIYVRSSNMGIWLGLGKFCDIMFSAGGHRKVCILN